ncbi:MULTISPECIES: sensor histidine kinase [Streptomyces]|uniref:sensor histidine kinase n=1 Tax=Streptomyces TaxID=1883 RepID=UPI000767BCFF|nr:MULTISPECIES: HAMP domain-containing sensor histidine kinase [Streptomyces]MBW8093437.1 HAMP domain-containing histidine kinase [Streptomyces hygroscopicus subsp. hygroscopicus]MCO8302704.1 HAMP domain-containing histidine kinase [Streptomyces sp. RKCA744]
MRLLPRSLRGQITVSVAVFVMTVVAVAGWLIVRQIDARDRADIDRQLMARAARAADGQDVLLAAHAPSSDDGLNDMFDTETAVRVRSGNKVIAVRGQEAATSIPFPARNGYRTLAADGHAWRSLVKPLGTSGDDRVQILQDLAPFEQRRIANTRTVTLVAAAAAFAAAAGVWLIARLLLEPLRRLREGAAGIRAHDGTRRLPAPARPREVADLAQALNGMLVQLQCSMLATRRFTADAGHELRTPLTSIGMTLETLRRNPALPAERRQQALEAMAAEHTRITALLAGLQQLARGDAGAHPTASDIDLDDLVLQEVAQARERHPGTRIDVLTPGQPLVIRGWEAGLRLAVSNLLANAALHGRIDGHACLALTSNTGSIQITVTDDGPGIPVGQREAMKGRFTRGERPRSEGSGLGLALVEQQATLHGGQLELTDGPHGGLKAILTFPSPTD